MTLIPRFANLRPLASARPRSLVPRPAPRYSGSTASTFTYQVSGARFSSFCSGTNNAAYQTEWLRLVWDTIADEAAGSVAFVFDYRGIAVREATCLARSALPSDLTRGLARACHLAPEVEGETFAGVVNQLGEHRRVLDASRPKTYRFFGHRQLRKLPWTSSFHIVRS